MINNIKRKRNTLFNYIKTILQLLLMNAFYYFMKSDKNKNIYFFLYFFSIIIFTRTIQFAN